MRALENLLIKKPKKYLIFDFDETLFVLDLPWRRYRIELTKKLSDLDPDLPPVKGIENLENLATQKWGLKAAEMRWEYSRYFEDKYLSGVTELTDLTNFIRNNHNQYLLYLWTSNMRETVEPILQKSGLLTYFTQLVTKGDVLLMKPYPEGFDKLYDQQTQKKYDFLMIGNSRNDKKAAEAAAIDYWMRP